MHYNIDLGRFEKTNLWKRVYDYSNYMKQKLSTARIKLTTNQFIAFNKKAINETSNFAFCCILLYHTIIPM